MTQHFKGLRLTFASLAVFCFSIFLLEHFQAIWITWQSIIPVAIYGVFAVVIVFSLQFNQSRFTYLALIWLVYLVIITGTYFPSTWRNSELLLYLIGSSWLFLLAYSKDRSVFSLHFIVKIISFSLVAILAWLWLLVSDFLMIKYGSQYQSLLPQIQFYIPTSLFVSLLFWRAIRLGQFISTSLLISFVVWTLLFTKMFPLDTQITILVIAIFYLLAMVLDTYFLAYRDELTNLPTRRALKHLALSLSGKYVVAMLDIDHFKKFNDTYGHDIGDQVLKLVASKLAKVRKGGKIFRYGGEEFTIVFPRRSMDIAIEELEKIRQSVANYSMVIRQERKTKQDRRAKATSNEKSVSVTISIGVASKEPKQNFEQVIKSADLALYRAKKKGRNNVSC